MTQSKIRKQSNEDHKDSMRECCFTDQKTPTLFNSNESSILRSNRQSQRSKKSVRLSDLMAAMYPGVKVGHKHCVQRPLLVPKTMGWLWNTEDTATGMPFPRKWRPGAIALGVKRRSIRSHSLTEPLTTPAVLKGRRIKKKTKTVSSTLTKTTSENETVNIQRPRPGTLYVKKKGEVYHVMMQPIKDLDVNENGEPEKPIQFKIADNSSCSVSKSSKSSSSSIKIEYLCSGALRKPVEKPELAEMGTQWNPSDISKIEKKIAPEQKESLKKRTKISKN